MSDPAFGEFDIPGFPVKFSDWPDRTDLKASRLGEDNDAILREMLAISDTELNELYGSNVLLKARPAEESRKGVLSFCARITTRSKSKTGGGDHSGRLPLEKTAEEP